MVGGKVETSLFKSRDLQGKGTLGKTVVACHPGRYLVPLLYYAFD